MQSVNECGMSSVVLGTTSGVGTIGAGNPCNLIGIFVGNALTAQLVNLWTQTGNAVLSGQPIVGTCSLVNNTYYKLPAFFPKGITYCITNENTNLTFFWVPAK